MNSIIGPDSGSINAVDTNGTEFILTIPEGALLYDEEITMTPIASAAGEGFEDTFIAGVDLQPDGLQFLEMVSLEITGPAIEEEAFGFSTETDGQNFQPIPSTAAGSSVTIPTTHFSEFGISEISQEEYFEFREFLSDTGQAAALTFGNDRQQIAALDRWVDQLLSTGRNGINLDTWESWTIEILSFLLRANEVIRDNGDESVPGFTDLTTKIQNLIDLWFQQSDGVFQEIVDKCIQGEIDYLQIGALIYKVGLWLNTELTLEGTSEHFRAWDGNIDTCYNFTVVWQSNVITEGTRDDFKSDISLGAESLFVVDQTLFDGRSIPLEVEYIQGFWDNVCVPENGTAKISAKLNYLPRNLGEDSVNLLESIFV